MRTASTSRRRGTVLMFVLVAVVIAAIIGAGLAQMLMRRRTMAARLQTGVTGKILDETAVGWATGYWAAQVVANPGTYAGQTYPATCLNFPSAPPNPKTPTGSPPFFTCNGGVGNCNCWCTSSVAGTPKVIAFVQGTPPVCTIQACSPPYSNGSNCP